MLKCKGRGQNRKYRRIQWCLITKSDEILVQKSKSKARKTGKTRNSLEKTAKHYKKLQILRKTVLTSRIVLTYSRKMAILMLRDSEDTRAFCSLTPVPPRADVGVSVFLFLPQIYTHQFAWYAALSDNDSACCWLGVYEKGRFEQPRRAILPLCGGKTAGPTRAVLPKCVLFWEINRFFAEKRVCFTWNNGANKNHSPCAAFFWFLTWFSVKSSSSVLLPPPRIRARPCSRGRGSKSARRSSVLPKVGPFLKSELWKARPHSIS